MAFTSPYQQHHYLGEVANSGSDAEILAVIQALEWDTNKDGTGNPEEGMLYYDTTNDVLKYYGPSSWNTLGTATPPSLSAVLAQGNDTGGNDIDVNNGDDVGIESGATLTVEGGGTLNVAATGTIAIADNGILTIADVTDCTFTGTPVSGTDPVNKAYVDSVATGMTWKEPVIVRAQGNINLSAPGATIDGVTMSVGDRFLADQQTTVTQDGIYEYQGAATPATRTADAQVGDAFAGVAMFIEQGTDADKGYVCTNDTGSDVVGTNDLTFVAFTGGGALSAGNGIDITGSVISVDTLTAGGLKFAGTGVDELAVEPADFAGTGLQDDGSDNLELLLYGTKVSTAGDSDAANNPLYLDSTNGVNVKVDASTIDLDSGNADRLYVPNGGITETQLNSSVAGTGLTGGGGSALTLDLYATKVTAAGSADVLNNPIYLDATNGINIKVDASTIDLDSGNANRLYVPNGGITETQLNSSVAGTGLSGGGGTALTLDLYATKVSAAGSADVANNPIYLDATNGINIKVDASTIDLDAANANRLYVPNQGITETQIATSVAGNGLTGGGGSALAVSPADTATKGGILSDSDGVYTCRTGAGNPNGSVTGDLGQLYIDSNNGIQYIYNSPTSGNNQWKVI